jgi:hypothetical protein
MITARIESHLPQDGRRKQFMAVDTQFPNLRWHCIAAVGFTGEIPPPGTQVEIHTDRLNSGDRQPQLFFTDVLPAAREAERL